MKPFKLQFITIVAILSCFNFNSMNVPIPAEATVEFSKQALDFLIKNSDKLTVAGMAVIDYFSKKEIPEDNLKDFKQEEKDKLPNNTHESVYEGKNKEKASSLRGCGTSTRLNLPKLPPIPNTPPFNIIKPGKSCIIISGDDKTLEERCGTSKVDKRLEPSRECNFSKLSRFGNVGDRKYKLTKWPKPEKEKESENKPEDKKEKKSESKDDSKTKKSEGKTKDKRKKHKTEPKNKSSKRGQVSDSDVDKKTDTVRPATKAQDLENTVKGNTSKALPINQKAIAIEIAASDAKEILYNIISAAEEAEDITVDRVIKALSKLDHSKLQEISRVVELLSNPGVKSNLEDQIVVTVIKNMADAAKTVRADEASIKKFKETNRPGAPLPGSKVYINGVLTTQELLQEMKDGFVLQDQEGNIFVYDVEHVLGGTIDKRKFTGWHYAPTKRIMELVKKMSDPKYNPLEPNNLAETDVKALYYKLPGSAFIRFEGKPSSVFFGPLSDFKKICSSGWQNLVKSGKLAETAEKFENDNNKNKATLTGTSQCGYTITFQGIDFTPGARAVGTFYISGYEKPSVQPYVTPEAMRSPENNNILKNEAGAYQDYQIRSNARSYVLNAKQDAQNISAYELAKKVIGFNKMLKNNSFSQGHWTYGNIEILTIPGIESENQGGDTELTFMKDINHQISETPRYDLNKPADADRSFDFGGQFTVNYKTETPNVQGDDYSQALFLLKNREYNYLIANNEQFRKEYKESQDWLIELVASSNCTPGKNKYGHPMLAKLMMVYAQEDPYVSGVAFNHLRDKLLGIYFDKKTGDLKDISSANEEKDATKAIVEFVYDISPNQEMYIQNLDKLIGKKVYHIKDIIHQNKMLHPDNFSRDVKRPPFIKLNRDIEFMKTIIDNPNVKEYTHIGNLLLNKNFPAARKYIEQLNCSREIKEDLTYMHRVLFYQVHDEHGIYNAFASDPILSSLTMENYKELNKNVESIENFNSILLMRHVFAKQWAEKFNITNLDNKILKNYLYEFAYLAKDQEKAIDALLPLSIDHKSGKAEKIKEAYYAFFNNQGILKNLEQNKLLTQYSFPETLATSKAAELRQYLNYTLVFDVNEKSEMRLKQILDYINEAANQIDKDQDKAEDYMNIIKGLYNAISLEGSDKTILKCDSFLNIYEDTAKQNMQDVFTSTVSNCVKLMNNVESIEEYNNKCDIVKNIILYANYGQNQLYQNNIESAEIISNLLSKIFYDNKKNINIKEAEKLALLLRAISIPNNI